MTRQLCKRYDTQQWSYIKTNFPPNLYCDGIYVRDLKWTPGRLYPYSAIVRHQHWGNLHENNPEEQGWNSHKNPIRCDDMHSEHDTKTKLCAYMYIYIYISWNANINCTCTDLVWIDYRMYALTAAYNLQYLIYEFIDNLSPFWNLTHTSVNSVNSP